MAGQQRLLVFETDPAVRRVVTRRLSREGYDVVDLAVETPPDLVRLEVGGAVGVQPLINVRETSDVAVIGLLWPESDYDEGAILDLGADDCVTRPLSFRLLVPRIRAVLRRASPVETRELRFG